jgi:acyl-CoA thioesterase-1
MSRTVYVAFGDSITAGYGVVKGFVFFLCAKITYTYPALNLLPVNTGMSGDNSRDGLRRLNRDVLQYSPDLVTINFGINDAFSGISADQFTQNLERMAQEIRASGCSHIVFLSSEAIPEPWAEKQVLPFWDAMRKAAEKTGNVYADVHNRWLRELEAERAVSNLTIPGDLHPSEEGHRLIAEAVFEAIQEHGLLDSLQP